MPHPSPKAGPRPAAPGWRVRAPQDLAGAAVLVALGLGGVWAVSHLPQGSLTMPGPAMAPRWIAAAIASCGAVLAARAMAMDGPPLPRMPLRGPLWVTTGIAAFGLAIGTVGFLPAAAAMALLAGRAHPALGSRELAVVAVALTAACALLFRVLLDLPILMLDVPGTSISF